MKLIIDNIVFSLQKAGGISTLWGELVQSVKNDRSIEVSYLEYENATTNIVRAELDIDNDKVGNSERTYMPLALQRFFNPKLPKQKNRFLFFSSYYRTCSNKNAVNITLVHDFTHEHYHKGIRKFIHSWQKRYAVEKADGIICISENTKKDLLHFFPHINSNKIKVIYNGVADHFFPISETSSWTEINVKYKYLDRSRVVLFIGSRTGYKNFALAVETMRILPQNYHLVIIGGPLSNKEEFDLKNSLKNNNFTAFSNIDNCTLNKIYNKGFVLLYPSAYEGFGIPVLEAMKAGIPVIAQNRSSIPEVADDAGILIDDPTAENFAVAIRSLENEEYYQKLVDKGVKRASHFSWAKTMHLYVSFFQHLYEKNEK